MLFDELFLLLLSMFVVAVVVTDDAIMVFSEGCFFWGFRVCVFGFLLIQCLKVTNEPISSRASPDPIVESSLTNSAHH